MPYKQIIRSEVPDSNTPHFLALAGVIPAAEFIATLRMAYSGKILSKDEVAEGNVITHTLVWADKSDLDSFNTQLREAFPTFHSMRDEYHRSAGVNFSVTYEEI